MEKIVVNVGGVAIGGASRLSVQTMCNTHTSDIKATVAQCITMAERGADLIRITTPTLKDVEALQVIKNSLRSAGINTPLVADVHFNSEIATRAAQVVEKVRINPGNFASVHKDASEKFQKLIEVCKREGTALRIGLNHGSLGKEITERYGNTPRAMKEAVMQWVKMAEALNFHNMVLSLKASNTLVMSEAYRLLYGAMEEEGRLYPLHLGVTEAGGGDTGRIKSAIGIGSLLKEGIGDTIRVSLTEDPVNEIVVGKIIADFFESGKAAGVFNDILRQAEEGSKCPVINYNSLNINGLESREKEWEKFLLYLSCSAGVLLLNKKIDDFTVKGYPFEKEKFERLKEDIEQGARRKFTHPEYIACPGCGRTMYNLEKTLNRVKERTAHLKGIKIAVMGCIVNGPGEMADADFGYVGQGAGKVAIYRGKTPVYEGVEETEAIDLLLKLIEQQPPITSEERLR